MARSTLKLFCLMLLAIFCNNKSQAQDIKTAQSDSTTIKSIAIQAVQKVDQSGKWLDALSPSDLNELPIGLKNTVSNVTYKIAISSAVFHDTYAELTVYAKVEIPQEPKQLFFGLSGLKLSYTGGIVGDAKLVLLGDVPLNISGGNAQLILKGGFNIKNGQPADLTYVSMDCNGFKEMSLAADIVFPRSLLIPCDNDGNKILDESKRVSANFKTIVKDWNDILVSINLPKFQINKLESVVFTVSDAVFDFSDTRNSAEVVFPPGYELRHMQMPDPSMWRGVYVRNIQVMLPKAFKKNGERVSFGAQNLIIDNNGVTGNFYAKNVLSFNEGSASGWKFSVDEFSIGVEANQLVSAGFSGNLGLPIAEQDSLHYSAVVTQDNKYWLTVSPKGKMDFQLWHAKAELDSNSYIKLMIDHDEFVPEANLSGRITVSASADGSSKSLAEFKGITFRGMRLRTRAPYLTVDYFGYNGEIKVANFPASIDSIVLTANGQRADLSFGVKLTLMDNTFKASTRLDFSSRFEKTDDGRQRWKFDKVDLTSISLDKVKIAGLTLSGEIRFMHDDPVYGDGFAGGIRATFGSLGNAEVQVRAVFGKTTFRYWFVDGQAQWGDGIFVVGPLRVHGFAGGAYFRMSKNDLSAGTGKSLMPDYKPDSAMGLGIKAGVFFNAVKREVVDGMAEFEVAFNRNGGLNYIGFFGNAKFMGKLPGGLGNFIEKSAGLFNKIQSSVTDELKGLSDAAKISKIDSIQKYCVSNPQGAAMKVPVDTTEGTSNGISAYLGMFYDFQSSTFHANFDIYINTAGGLLQGIGNNYRAGWAVLHFAPGEWYTYMGTPKDPIGLKFGLGSFSLKVQAYFMLGTKIPGSPPPPQEVVDILGLTPDEADYMHDLNALGDGRGFAFGARLSVETGDITFLILYANFKAGVGFDMMLKQYTDAHCEGSTEPIGINGWYANAQVYAYLQGELGVKVHLWFINTKFPLIQGAAAALLQAKLPNPSSMVGYLGVKFSILGGLVKGSYRFKLKLGNECKIVSGGEKENPLGIAVISTISPKDTTNVDVFSAPQVAFNFAVGKEIAVPDEHGEKLYRINLDQFELQCQGKTIPGKLQWNSNNDAVTFYSTEVLPSSAVIVAKVKVSFMQQNGAGWQTVYVDGQKSEESRTLTFTTGTAPEFIPLTNILYAWPVVAQRSFYPGETNQGMVQLKRGQTYLFNAAGYHAQLFLQPTIAGELTTLPFAYDSASCKLRFNIFKVGQDADYSLLLVSYPVGVSASAAIAQIQTTTINGTDSLNVTTKQAQDVKRTDIGKTLLTYAFHSSKYNTFSSRIKSMETTSTVLMRLSSDLISMQQGVFAADPFDVAEIEGNEYTNMQPLIQPIAIPDDAYFTQDVLPLNYNRYPVDGFITLDRDTATLGFLPLRALPLSVGYQSLIEQGNFTDPQVTKFLPYIYDLPRVYKEDFLDLQAKVVNKYLGTYRQKDFEWLINGYFPFIREGFYKVNYQFVLPDGTRGSSYYIEYKNPIK